MCPSPAISNRSATDRTSLKERIKKITIPDESIKELVSTGRATIAKCIDLEHNKVTKEIIANVLANYVSTLEALCAITRSTKNKDAHIVEIKAAMKEQANLCSKKLEEARTRSYAQATAGPTSPPARPTATKHVIKVFPKDPAEIRSSEATKHFLMNKVDISKVKVNIKAIKPIGRGGISILVNQKEEIDTLKAAIEPNKELQATVDAKSRPTFSFIIDGKDHNPNDLKRKIINKNQLFTKDTFDVVHIRKPNQHNFSIGYISIAPSLYPTLASPSFRLFLGWGAAKVRECDPLTQCHNCWRFGHKQSKCRFEMTGEKATRCCRCGGVNCDSNCSKTLACPNCSDFNNKVKKSIHPTAHSANDPSCPSRKHAEKIARERVDYGS